MSQNITPNNNQDTRFQKVVSGGKNNKKNKNKNKNKDKNIHIAEPSQVATQAEIEQSTRKKVQFAPHPVDLATLERRMPAQSDRTLAQPQPQRNMNIHEYKNRQTKENVALKPILKSPSPKKFKNAERDSEYVDPLVAPVQKLVDSLVAFSKVETPKNVMMDQFVKVVTVCLNSLKSVKEVNMDLKVLQTVFELYQSLTVSINTVCKLSYQAEAEAVVEKLIARVCSIAVLHLSQTGLLLKSHINDILLTRVYMQIVRLFSWIFNKKLILDACYKEPTLNKMIGFIITQFLGTLTLINKLEEPFSNKKALTNHMLLFFRDIRVLPSKWTEKGFSATMEEICKVPATNEAATKLIKLEVIHAFINTYPGYMGNLINSWFVSNVIVPFLQDVNVKIEDIFYHTISNILDACVTAYSLKNDTFRRHFFLLLNLTQASEVQGLNPVDSPFLTFGNSFPLSQSTTVWSLITSKLLYLQSFDKNYKTTLNIWESLSILAFSVSSNADMELHETSVLNPIWISINKIAFMSNNIRAKKQALVSRKVLAFILMKLISAEENNERATAYANVLFELTSPELMSQGTNDSSLLLYHMQYLFKISRLTSLYTYECSFENLNLVLSRLFIGFKNLYDFYVEEKDKILKHQITLLQKLLQAPEKPETNLKLWEINSAPVTKLTQISPFNNLSQHNTAVCLNLLYQLMIDNPNSNYQSCVISLIRRCPVSNKNSILFCDLIVALLDSCANEDITKTVFENISEELIRHFKKSIISSNNNETIFSAIFKKYQKISEVDYFKILQTVTNSLKAPEIELGIFASLINISPSMNVYIQNYCSTRLLPSTMKEQGLLGLETIMNAVPTEQLIVTYLTAVKEHGVHEVFNNVTFSHWSLETIIYFFQKYSKILGNNLSLTCTEKLLVRFEEQPVWIWPILEVIINEFQNHEAIINAVGVSSEIAYVLLFEKGYRLDSLGVEQRLKTLSECGVQTVIITLIYVTQYNLLDALETHKGEVFKSLYHLKIELQESHRQLSKILNKLLNILYKNGKTGLLCQFIQLFNHTGFLSIVFSFISLSDFDITQLSLTKFSGLGYYLPAGQNVIDTLLKNAPFIFVNVIVEEWICLRSVYSFVTFMENIVECYAKGEEIWSSSEKSQMLKKFNSICFYILKYAEIDQYQKFAQLVVDKFSADTSYGLEIKYITLVQPGFKYPKLKKEKNKAKKFRRKNWSTCYCFKMRLGYETTPPLKDFDLLESHFVGEEENALLICDALKKIERDAIEHSKAERNQSKQQRGAKTTSETISLPNTFSDSANSVNIVSTPGIEPLASSNNANITQVTSTFAEADIVASSTQGTTESITQDSISSEERKALKIKGKEPRILLSTESNNDQVSMEAISEYSSQNDKTNNIDQESHITSIPKSTEIVQSSVSKEDVFSSLSIQSQGASSQDGQIIVSTDNITTNGEISQIIEIASTNEQANNKDNETSLISDTQKTDMAVEVSSEGVSNDASSVENAQSKVNSANTTGPEVEIPVDQHESSSVNVLNSNLNGLTNESHDLNTGSEPSKDSLQHPDTTPIENLQDNLAISSTETVSSSAVEKTSPVESLDTPDSNKKHRLDEVPVQKRSKKPKVSALKSSKVRKIVAAMRRFTDEELEVLNDDEKERFKYELSRFMDKL